MFDVIEERQWRWWRRDSGGGDDGERSRFAGLGGSTHTIRRNTDAVVVASKEICLEENAEKTKYMVMSRN
jgi:hypothetical protein